MSGLRAVEAKQGGVEFRLSEARCEALDLVAVRSGVGVDFIDFEALGFVEEEGFVDAAGEVAVEVGLIILSG